MEEVGEEVERKKKKEELKRVLEDERYREQEI